MSMFVLLFATMFAYVLTFVCAVVLLFISTTVLKQIEYWLYKEDIRAHSKIRTYLLQDGCM